MKAKAQIPASTAAQSLVQPSPPCAFLRHTPLPPQPPGPVFGLRPLDTRTISERAGPLGPKSCAVFTPRQGLHSQVV